MWKTEAVVAYFKPLSWHSCQEIRRNPQLAQPVTQWGTKDVTLLGYQSVALSLEQTLLCVSPGQTKQNPEKRSQGRDSNPERPV